LGNQSVERGGEADHHHNGSSAVALISGGHYPLALMRADDALKLMGFDAA
jgi:hypothetical protein